MLVQKQLKSAIYGQFDKLTDDLLEHSVMISPTLQRNESGVLANNNIRIKCTAKFTWLWKIQHLQKQFETIVCFTHERNSPMHEQLR